MIIIGTDGDDGDAKVWPTNSSKHFQRKKSRATRTDGGKK